MKFLFPFFLMFAIDFFREITKKKGPLPRLVSTFLNGIMVDFNLGLPVELWLPVYSAICRPIYAYYSITRMYL